jgi:hypothetical protein
MDKKKAEKLEIEFNPEEYTMEEVAGIVANFLGRECAKKQNATVLPGLNIGIFLGGYSTNEPLGESWSVEIKVGKPTGPTRLRQPDQPGINWGGQSEVLQRIVLGFSPALYQVLAEVSGAQGQGAVSPQQLFEQLNPLLMARLQAPVVFAPMPIQDAIDLGRFLVHSAIMYSRFLPGPQTVGGPIEIAAITKHEGFKWISRKHYYDYSLNQEPRHVIVDRQRES